jgi:hypothetical protein
MGGDERWGLKNDARENSKWVQAPEAKYMHDGVLDTHSLATRGTAEI